MTRPMTTPRLSWTLLLTVLAPILGACVDPAAQVEPETAELHAWLAETHAEAFELCGPETPSEAEDGALCDALHEEIAAIGDALDPADREGFRSSCAALCGDTHIWCVGVTCTASDNVGCGYTVYDESGRLRPYMRSCPPPDVEMLPIE